MLPASTMFSVNGLKISVKLIIITNNYTVIMNEMMLRNKLLFYFLHLM